MIAGWKVEQNTSLGDAMFGVTGKVKNISDDTSTASIHFKFIDKSGEVLGKVQCNSADLEQGQISSPQLHSGRQIRQVQDGHGRSHLLRATWFWTSQRPPGTASQPAQAGDVHGMVDWPLRATPRASSHYPAVAAAGASESRRIRHSFGAVQGGRPTMRRDLQAFVLSLGSLLAVTGSVLLVLWAVAN
jgi:hypothetical protein